MKTRAFTLFATHYFELTSLADEVPGVANLHLDATEHGDSLVFLHAVKDGPANRSYGLAVAQLAGVPRDVIAAARTPQAALPFGTTIGRPGREPSALEQRLASLDPDALTPREALQLLYELQRVARDGLP